LFSLILKKWRKKKDKTLREEINKDREEKKDREENES